MDVYPCGMGAGFDECQVSQRMKNNGNFEDDFIKRHVHHVQYDPIQPFLFPTHEWDSVYRAVPLFQYLEMTRFCRDSRLSHDDQLCDN